MWTPDGKVGFSLWGCPHITALLIHSVSTPLLPPFSQDFSPLPRGRGSPRPTPLSLSCNLSCCWELEELGWFQGRPHCLFRVELKPRSWACGVTQRGKGEGNQSTGWGSIWETNFDLLARTWLSPLPPPSPLPLLSWTLLSGQDWGMGKLASSPNMKTTSCRTLPAAAGLGNPGRLVQLHILLKARGLGRVCTALCPSRFFPALAEPTEIQSWGTLKWGAVDVF